MGCAVLIKYVQVEPVRFSSVAEYLECITISTCLVQSV